MQEEVEVYPYRRLHRQHSDTSERKTKPAKSFRGPGLHWPNPGQAFVKLASLQEIMLLALGFFVSRGIIMEELVPMAPAFYAAAVFTNRQRKVPLLIAMALGLFTILVGSAYWYSILVLFVLALAIGRVGRTIQTRWYFVPAMVFVANMSVKSLALLAEQPTLYQSLILIFESVFTAGLSGAFLIPLQNLGKKGPIARNLEEIICAAVVGMALIMGISDLHVGFFSVGGIASRLVIMLLALQGGAALGAASGVAVGIIPSISTIIVPSVIGTYAFSGLLAGLMRNWGKIGVATGAFLGNLMLSLYIIDARDLTKMLLETAVALAFLFGIPARCLDIAGRKVLLNAGGTAADDRARYQELVARKLQDLGELFKELSRAFREISTEMDSHKQERLGSIFHSVTTKVCGNCPVFAVCWQTEVYNTYQQILDLFAAVEIKGKIGPEDIPAEIRKRCVRTKELAITVNCLFDTYRLDSFWRNKVEEAKGLVAAQLLGVSGIMGNLAQEIRFNAGLQEELENRLQAELLELGLAVERVEVVEAAEGNLEIYVYKEPCTGKMECNTLMVPLVSHIFNQAYGADRSGCALKSGELVCCCKLVPKTSYQVTTGVAQQRQEGTMVCGDCHSILHIKGGKLAVALSDGMGAGARAARESSVSLALLNALLSNGFDKDLALKTINSTLTLRSQSETFATVDLVLLDTYTGEAEFVKIGAPPSFLKRGAQVGVVKSTNVPIGILQKIEIESVIKHLRPGDILVMVTDGILDVLSGAENKEELFCSILRDIRAGEAQELAELLLLQALAMSEERSPGDDMTVLVVSLDKWE